MRGDGPTPAAGRLGRVCEVAVADLGMSGAVVSLMSSRPADREQAGTIAASSSESARSVEELEFSLGEGPGTDAFRGSRPVLTPDLGQALGRWPGYAPAAYAVGVRSTFAFPMLVGAARFGVLHLHGAQVRHLTGPDVTTGLVLTELATEAVLDDLAPTRASIDAPLLGATDGRDEIYQAQGMVMVELGVSLSTALALLRAHAFATGQDLADLAADIVAGRARLQPDSEPDPTP